MITIEQEFNPQALLSEKLSEIEKSFVPENEKQWIHELIRWLAGDKTDIIWFFITEMMEQSVKDNQILNRTFIRPGYLGNIFTFPYSAKQAKRSYYQNGYFRFLGKFLKDDRKRIYKSHYIHIQYFFDGSQFETAVTLLPNEKLLRFTPTYFVPNILLKNEEIMKIYDLYWYKDSKLNNFINLDRYRPNWKKGLRSIIINHFFNARDAFK